VKDHDRQLSETRESSSKSSVRGTLKMQASLITSKTTCLLWLSLLLSSPLHCRGNDYKRNIDGRHSFSLSTFDPSGRLDQVAHAEQAAALGTPVIAICRPSSFPADRQEPSADSTTAATASTARILLAAPQVLPSPLIHDDGTARFARITHQILVAHSGIAADGRVLVAAAQQMAIEHEYAYDEAIPLDIFLEEVSLLFQDYTMRAATRPFGVTLIVAYLASPSDQTTETASTSLMPQLYRIGPSGTVESLGNYAIVNGNKLQKDDTLWSDLKDLAETKHDNTLEEDRIQLQRILQKALERSSASPSSLSSSSSSPPKESLKSSLKEPEADKESVPPPTTTAKVLPSNLRRILTASLFHKEGTVFKRYELNDDGTV